MSKADNEEIALLEIGEVFKTPTYKSELLLENIIVRFTKKFNWFNRLMLRLVFGLNIKNIKEE